MSDGGAARVVLSVNVGSSSLKLALYRFDGDAPIRLARVSIEAAGSSRATLHVEDAAGARTSPMIAGASDRNATFHQAVEALGALGLPEPTAVGHRMVHGGPRHFEPTLVTGELVAELERLVAYAPLHLPAELAALAAARERFPRASQVVCFDTGFHRTMPELARRLPLPRELADRGLRRYGFHGLSYEHVVSRLDAASLGRAVIAHLGSGASLVAIRNGRSVDTTMGLTPAGGIMMGTRPGDLDPGVLLRLLADGWDYARIERLIEHESGLLGVSGSTSDMRALLDERARNPNAALAIELFVTQIAKAIGAFTTVLGGLATLVFTGGIGERSAVVRAEVCARLAHLGVTLDQPRNDRDEAVISSGRCTVHVMTTDEELVLARAARRIS